MKKHYHRPIRITFATHIRPLLKLKASGHRYQWEFIHDSSNIIWEFLNQSNPIRVRSLSIYGPRDLISKEEILIMKNQMRDWKTTYYIISLYSINDIYITRKKSDTSHMRNYQKWRLNNILLCIEIDKLKISKYIQFICFTFPSNEWCL